LPTADWLYTVTITNSTADVLPEITLFYKRRNLSGVVYYSQYYVTPNTSVIFGLGVCSEMESYVFGLYDTDGTLLAKFPDQGNYTAEMGASDGRLCEDSWTISA